MKEQVTEHIINGKIASAGAGSFVTGMIAMAERFGPVIDAMVGLTSIAGMLLAAWWTVMRIRDQYAARRNSKSEKSD